MDKIKKMMIYSFLLLFLGVGSFLTMILGFDIGTNESTLGFYPTLLLFLLNAIPIFFAFRLGDKVERLSKERTEKTRCRTIGDVHDYSEMFREHRLEFNGYCTVKHQDGTTMKINHSYIRKDFVEYIYNNEKRKSPVLIVFSEHHDPIHFYMDDLESYEFDGKKWENPHDFKL